MIVEPEHAGIRLDVFVSETEQITRSAAQKLIASGLVTVNGIIPAKNCRLRENDEVETDFPEPIPAEAQPQNLPIEIVYEDADLLVVNKPKGMVVHPAPGNYEGTLVNALLYHVRGLSGINGVIRPGIVHRIDKDTSGLLIVAKNDAAHLSLAGQIKAHTFDREYRAVLVGNLKLDSGTIDAPIGRNPRDRKKMAVIPGGRPARTHYEVLERYKSNCCVRLILETGRTHQIRVHMASVGHPVLADPLYSNSQYKNLEGQCLHAKTIGFTHPRTGERLSFDSELPDYFTEVLKKLREE